jgi:hypothetical protein
MARRVGWDRRLVPFAVVLGCLLALALLAGTLSAAHRDQVYRHSVDQSFAASASALVESSNVTGVQLASLMADPGALGRVLLESRLQQMAQQAVADAATSARLLTPPPDANAHIRIVNMLRLRASAVVSIRETLQGLLGLTPTNPTGTAGPEPDASAKVGVPGARALLRYAGQQLVLADRDYRGLPYVFYLSSAGASLPPSQWTSPATGRLMPMTLKASAAPIATDPRLAASIQLSIVAVQTEPLLLPVGPGYPVAPTTTFTAAISVVNAGSSPTVVIALIRVRPLGKLGVLQTGRADGVAMAQSAVALHLPVMAVVPGEHCLVTIDLVRPRLQKSSVGLHWARTVVIAAEPAT